MTYFAHNLALLRKHRGISQQELSRELDIPRSTISGYEQSYAEPDISTLIRFSDFFQLDLSNMLKEQLNAKNILQFLSKENSSRIIIGVDNHGRNQVQLVDTKAEAGYIESFNDPEYIKELPVLNLPQIPQGIFRAFEVQGDSMLPMEPGSIVIASHVERLGDIKEGHTYVVASREGLVYKRVYQSSKKQALHLVSDNEVYTPYELLWTDVKEIWKYFAHVSFTDGKANFDAMIDEKWQRVYRQVDDIHRHLMG
jgi:transcriptional regulator with XRE-family HTH domain